ncbi:2OG-Fe dioxygenase family protein [Mycobacterium asiaticum]|uniref:2OG-Fe dioxygenase family protein n=1 Tax=Mycobacterium asiaticum TaxID=1790 RepID=UPI0007EFDDFA|nr:2OG-Fe dioxygenase family protein [Mycobacterium asiaticum]OBJ60087.1 hypothetical protein A9W94_13970 [Mycobacterium asiaticum]
MVRIASDEVTHGDPLAAATRELTSTGVAVLPAFALSRSLGIHLEEWIRFGRHWDDLSPDPYAAELGTRRLRRYGRYLMDDTAHPVPTEDFVQPEDSNPLYIGKSRQFEPLTPAFAEDPVLHGLLAVLRRIASALDEVTEWNVKVHPFRSQSSRSGNGRPTPEGMHRDGVTLVSSLLIRRRNALGGQSVVRDPDGRQLLAITLAEPGTLLLGDDRRTVHGVSPIRPIDDSGPAQRDVLVITFASC